MSAGVSLMIKSSAFKSFIFSILSFNKLFQGISANLSETFISVLIVKTTVIKMITIIKPQYLKILRLFYPDNKPLHLREISRRIGLKESATSRHLNNLSILDSYQEANLRKFKIKEPSIKDIFPIFDKEKLNNLPILRKNAIYEYIKKSKHKPLLLIIFGSTAKDTYKKESDIDIFEINNKNNKEVKEQVEAITGIKLQIFRLTQEQFYKELKQKQDHTIQSAIKTGFPVFNREFFYQIKNE